VARARCVEALDKLKMENDEQIGVNIVKRDYRPALPSLIPVSRDSDGDNSISP
jgi:hypothetical protein